jgi:altronate dehydratase large subunit
MKQLMGYQRSDGQYGIRNKVLVIATVGCSNETVRRITEQVPGTVFIPAGKGCGQIGESVTITKRTLTGFVLNPNVYGAVFVGLGCETIQPHDMAARVQRVSDKPVYAFSIQEAGGFTKTIQAVIPVLEQLVKEANQLVRVPFDIASLTLATNCGGSDATSGLSVNPALGYATELLVASGGRVILGETTELIGTEHILQKRAKNQQVAQAIHTIIHGLEKQFERLQVDIRGANPSPGNQKGGLTTLEEKSLGAIMKGGHATINQVVKYGEIVTEKGLVIMDTPGYDIESVTGMVAGGAQICVFTTGRGTPIGNPIVPMIKITGNQETYQKMAEHMDLNLAPIVTGEQTIQAGGEQIFAEILEVANGKETAAEKLGFQELAIYRNNEVWGCDL